MNSYKKVILELLMSKKSKMKLRVNGEVKDNRDADGGGEVDDDDNGGDDGDGGDNDGNYVDDATVNGDDCNIKHFLGQT